MSTNAIFVVAQRDFSVQVEIKIGIRRDEKIRPVEIRLKVNIYVEITLFKRRLTMNFPLGRLLKHACALFVYSRFD